MRAQTKFADSLRQWRGKTSQRLAANSLDVSLATYRNWEQERNEPHASLQASVYERIRRLQESGLHSKPKR